MNIVLNLCSTLIHSGIHAPKGRFASSGRSSAPAVLFLMALLMPVGSVKGGDIFLTGHDMFLHQGQQGYDKQVLDCFRGEASIDSYTIAVIGSGAGSWNFFTQATTSGYSANATYYNTGSLSGNAALWADALSKSCLIILGHESCSGCDLDDSGVAVIYAERTSIWAAFNAGMDLFVSSSANSLNYYDFLPPSFTAPSIGTSTSSGMSPTPYGCLTFGIESTITSTSCTTVAPFGSNMTSYMTHNYFGLIGDVVPQYSPLLTPVEVWDEDGNGSTGLDVGEDGRPAMDAKDYIISLAAKDIVLTEDCSAEDVVIQCGSEEGGADYTLTFEITNNSGYDATYLVVDDVVNGVNVSFPGGLHHLPISIPNTNSATVTLLLSGGNVGDIICIPVGLMALDEETDRPFECCGVEVCVELPSCCMDVHKFLALDDDGNIVFDFNVTNLAGEDPVVAEHVYLIPITPGVSILPDVHGLGGLNDNTSSLGLSSVIFNAAPGTEVCFWITLHDETLDECCWQRCCFRIPRDIPEEGLAHDHDGDDDVAGQAAGLRASHQVFRRGDSNHDGILNLSDGVHILGALFLGPPGFDCEDASDSNNDGTLDLSDAVSIFNYLFLGGFAPPSPGPTHCGPDPVAQDGLGCLTYAPCE